MQKTFRDSLGQTCEVIPGFAKDVFQGDRGGGNAGYFQSDQDCTQPEATLARMEGVANRVRLSTRLLDSVAPAENGQTLVIGASHGEECLWLANELGDQCGQITGTNLTELDPLVGGILDAFSKLLDNPEHAAHCASQVKLSRDDIAISSLPDKHFTRVFSWQTFEHVMDPLAGFQNLSRVLQPGGVGFIEYNPFFSVDGAHWPATIDIPWAHARMEQVEFERSVFSLHPDRQADAASFVHRAINRMTQQQMLGYARDAELELVAFLPRIRTEDILLLTPGIVDGVRAMYPLATAADLAARIVRVVVRKSPDEEKTKASCS